MSIDDTDELQHVGLTKDETLAARWDTVAYRAQGSPFEDLTVSCLAKNSGVRSWSRGPRHKGDTLDRYIYLSFEELHEVEKLDRKSVVHLIEICEATFLFEQECEELGSFDEIDNQAHAQRMRFVEEFGLYQDFPVRLANLDQELLDLCAAEDVTTFIELMAFLDRLSDKAWIGGAYQNLQNVFAHGDQRGLKKYFPYRLAHRGFHLPEAVGFCLDRLSRPELQAVFEYHAQRRRKDWLRRRKIEMPKVVEDRLLPEVLECLHYFGNRQPKLLVRLYDSAYLCRELMYLENPQAEGVIHWLIHLALGVFRPSESIGDVDDEIRRIRVPTDQAICRQLRELADGVGG